MSQQWGYDETEGVIIGGWFVTYEFWRKHPVFGWNELIAKHYFENDDEALEWFKENYPVEWGERKNHPIEMRVFDQPGKHEQAIIDARKAANG